MNRALPLILLSSGLLKVLLAVAFADLTPRYDEVEFLEFGRRVASGEAPVLWRAPGYQSFVAAGLALAGGRALGVRLLQVLLSVATTFLAYRLGRRLGGERVGLVAAAFLAFYPSHVAFSHLIWAETLFLFLTLFAFDRLLAAAAESKPAVLVMAGGLLGAAALVRSAGLVLLAASAVWWLLRRGRPAHLALLVGAAAVVVAPWSIHASLSAGRPVLIDTNPGWNLWSGNNEYVAADLQGVWGTGLPLDNGLMEAWGPRLREQGIPAEFVGARLEGDWRSVLRERLIADGIRTRTGPEADDWFRAHAVEQMKADPIGVIARVPLKLAAWWSPDFFLPRHLLRDWYGTVPTWLAGALLILTWLTAAVPLLLGPTSLLAMGRSPFTTLAASWTLALAAVHAVLFGVSRMHQPLVPLLVLAVALALFGAGEARRWRRGAIAGVLAAVLMLVSLPAVVGVYLGPGPRHVTTARVLTSVRSLPLPGTRHAAFTLAEIEAALGRSERAAAVLDGSAPAADAGTMLARAMVTDSASARADWVRRARAARPTSVLLKALEQVLERGTSGGGRS